MEVVRTGNESGAGQSAESLGSSRREFIKKILAVGAIGAAAGLGYYTLTLGSQQTKTTTKPSGVSYPSGKRFIMIPPLADYSDGRPYWNLLSYAPQDVLSMLRDLQPDTLHRYIQSVSSSGLDATATVPGSSPPMTVAEFVQASMDASGSVVIPKVTLRTYNSDPATFFSQTRAFVDMNVNPPMSMLSIDEWDTFQSAHGTASVALIEQIIDQLRSQGWSGVEVGACGAPEIPTGYTDFSLFCVDPSTWESDLSTLTSLKGIASNKSFQLSIDYPGPLQAFQKLTADKQAELLAGFASAQKEHGYSFVYPIALQFQGPAMLDYDSSKIVTSSGQTLYQVMKGLMEQYN